MASPSTYRQLHKYRFEFVPDSIRFYADGQLVKEWPDGLPANSMRLYVNAWYTAWLDGRRSNKDKYVLVDSIRHTRP